MTDASWLRVAAPIRALHDRRPFVSARGRMCVATGLGVLTIDVPTALRWALSAMAVGVSVSGLRDLYAAFGLPRGGWPWT